MRNIFLRKNRQDYLSSSFAKGGRAIAKSRSITTLDDALEYIDEKNKTIEKQKNSIKDRVPDRKQLFGIARAASCTKHAKSKITLPKVSMRVIGED